MARTKSASRKSSFGQSSIVAATIHQAFAPTPSITKKKKKATLVDKTKKKKAVIDVVVHHVAMNATTIYGYKSDEDLVHYTMYSAIRSLNDLGGDSPPSSPMRMNIFTRTKEYMFERPTEYLTPLSQKGYEFFDSVERKVIPSLYPNIDALHTKGVDEPIMDMFVRSGLVFILRGDMGTHPELVFEFLSAFEAKQDKGRYTVWRFVMGDLLWEVNAKVLRYWFRFPQEGTDPYTVIDSKMFAFWMRISGCDWRDSTTRLNSQIKVPVWTIIHKLIANIFFVRTDAGRFVSRVELAIMFLMEKGSKVDWLTVLTQGLLDYALSENKNKFIGGGSFVSYLAAKLFFSILNNDPSHDSLTLAGMKARQIINKDLEWRNTFAKGSALPSSPSLDLPSDIPSSSSRPPPPPTLEQKVDSILAWMTSFSERIGAMERTQVSILAALNRLAATSSPPSVPIPHETEPVTEPSLDDVILDEPQLGISIEEIDKEGELAGRGDDDKNMGAVDGTAASEP